MLRLALAPIPCAAVWSDEIDRAAAAPGSPSFWIDTLSRAHRIAPHGSDFWFIIGADQAAAFHRWRQPLDILALAEPIVLLRPPLVTPAALLDALRATGAWSAPQLARWERSIVSTPVLPTNATAIRDALSKGMGPADLDPAVARYIADHGLYAPSAQNPRTGP
jgi:nicotinate-nucleotide adenylyltransferase